MIGLIRNQGSAGLAFVMTDTASASIDSCLTNPSSCRHSYPCKACHIKSQHSQTLAHCPCITLLHHISATSHSCQCIFVRCSSILSAAHIRHGLAVSVIATDAALGLSRQYISERSSATAPASHGPPQLVNGSTRRHPLCIHKIGLQLPLYPILFRNAANATQSCMPF